MTTVMIEKLTPEQETKLPIVRDEWIRIGLDTAPLDQEKCKQAIRLVYQCADLPEPEVFVFLDSPLAGVVGAIRLIESQAQVGDQVRTQVGDQVWAQVWAQVWDQVWAQVRDQVWAQVWDQVWDQVWAQVWDQVWAQVRDQVWAQVWAQVRDQVWAQVRDQVRTQVGAQVCWSQHDAGWLSFYDYFLTVMELGCCDKLKGLIAAAKECGWFWPFEKTCIVTAKPCWISLDQQGRLHSEDRKAIEYPDGFGLYRWHGIEVPEDVILHPETITVEKIETEKNVEVRRIMLTRYGESRYIQDSGAVVVQEDQFGQLFRKEISGDEALVMVRVLNATPEQDGTVKPYWIRVRPDCTTAHGAVASTFGLTTEQYVPEQET